MFKFSCIIFFCVATLNSSAQALLRVTSADSVNFILNINRQSSLDSISSSYLMEVPSDEITLISIEDTLGIRRLKKELTIPSNTEQSYTLLTKDSSWTLLLGAISDYYPKPDSLPNNRDSLMLGSDSLKLLGNMATPAFVKSTFIKELESIRFERDKARFLENRIKEHPLSSQELKTALLILAYEDERARIIKRNAALLKGKISSSSIDDIFKLDKFRREVLEALK